ncbi:MAG: adenine-specific methyltransferase EcoRI family protein [Acholeplasmatales bacterium]|jgi:hypothetical protein|nr:adenine-specific methyltransferase EcoRI family protein [Acholeplasmatales bacterium]
MSNNLNLNKAKEIKNDEWYTKMTDISYELSLYKEQLSNKKIICPCDWDESFDEKVVYDSFELVSRKELNLFGESNATIKNINTDATNKNLKNSSERKCGFITFLSQVANDWNIKSVSASGYDPNTDKGVKFQDIDYSKYDVVITNPPFSCFREFIEILLKYPNLSFIVIGPIGAYSYKEFFNYLKSNKIWNGYTQPKGFIDPFGVEKKFGNICWWTNLDVSYRHEKIKMEYSYYESPSNYPKYDNYDAIEVNKIKNIPYDYEGLMGVSGATFLSRFNPSQFELLGTTASLGFSKGRPYINGLRKFDRLIIKNKFPVKKQEQQYEY